MFLYYIWPVWHAKTVLSLEERRKKEGNGQITIVQMAARKEGNGQWKVQIGTLDVTSCSILRYNKSFWHTLAYNERAHCVCSVFVGVVDVFSYLLVPEGNWFPSAPTLLCQAIWLKVNNRLDPTVTERSKANCSPFIAQWNTVFKLGLDCTRVHTYQWTTSDKREVYIHSCTCQCNLPGFIDSLERTWSDALCLMNTKQLWLWFLGLGEEAGSF